MKWHRDQGNALEVASWEAAWAETRYRKNWMILNNRNRKKFNSTKEIVICSRARKQVFLLQVHHTRMVRKDSPRLLQNTGLKAAIATLPGRSRKRAWLSHGRPLRVPQDRCRGT